MTANFNFQPVQSKKGSGAAKYTPGAQSSKGVVSRFHIFFFFLYRSLSSAILLGSTASCNGDMNSLTIHGRCRFWGEKPCGRVRVHGVLTKIRVLPKKSVLIRVKSVWRHAPRGLFNAVKLAFSAKSLLFWSSHISKRFQAKNKTAEGTPQMAAAAAVEEINIPEGTTTLRVVLKDTSNTKIAPLVLWPKTRLVTLIARALGVTSYSDLPSPTFTNYAFFLSPICYLFYLDLIDGFKAADVRHQEDEGRVLKQFRDACRKFFRNEMPEALLVEMSNTFLAYRPAPNIAMLDSDMDEMMSECVGLLTIHGRCRFLGRVAMRQSDSSLHGFSGPAARPRRGLLREHHNFCGGPARP